MAQLCDFRRSLVRHSETPPCYTATEVRCPVYQYVAVLNCLENSELSREPSTWSNQYYPGYDRLCTDRTGLLPVLDLVLKMLRVGAGVVCLCRWCTATHVGVVVVTLLCWPSRIPLEL